MKKTVFIFGLLVSVSISAKDCDEALLSAVEWRECIATKDENSLADSYASLIKALSGNQGALDAMKQAQADWVKFRDSTCSYVLEVDTREDAAACTAQFNTARIKMLKNYEKQAREKQSK